MSRLRIMVIGAAGGALVLLVVLLSGLPNVAASARPWPFATWLFETMVRQSVTLRSLAVTVPPLDDPAMVRRGAGHYELVCASCHGSPLAPPDAFAANLQPAPPLLTRQMAHWRPPERVFWTVRHGVRYSAMPAWPSPLRDDEVWSMVAFLEALPRLAPEEYAALSGAGADMCAACHTESDGRPPDPAFPRLDIQSPQYLADALRAFRDGTRASGTMHTVAKQLADSEIHRLAGLYGKNVRPAHGADTAGAAIARGGIPERKVPACESCHGASARPDYPRLSGQSASYIATQLRLFRKLGVGRGGRFAPVMAEVAHNLTDADIEALAEFYGTVVAGAP